MKAHRLTLVVCCQLLGLLAVAMPVTLALAAEAAPELDIMLGSARKNLEAGKLDRVEKTLADAKRYYPNEGQVDLLYGLLFAHREKPEEAVTSFKAAIEKSPTLRDAYLHLALQLDVLGRYDASDKVYADATKRFASDTELLGEWGTTLILRKRFDEAQKVLKQALTQKPSDPQLLADYAYTHLRTGKADDAVKLYERSFTAGMKEPQVRRQYGDALAAAGNLEAAENTYSQLLTIAPNDPDLLYRRAKIRVARGDKAGADADTKLRDSLIKGKK